MEPVTAGRSASLEQPQSRRLDGDDVVLRRGWLLVRDRSGLAARSVAAAVSGSRAGCCRAGGDLTAPNAGLPARASASTTTSRTRSRVGSSRARCAACACRTTLAGRCPSTVPPPWPSQVAMIRSSRPGLCRSSRGGAATRGPGRSSSCRGLRRRRRVPSRLYVDLATAVNDRSAIACRVSRWCRSAASLVGKVSDQTGLPIRPVTASGRPIRYRQLTRHEHQRPFTLHGCRSQALTASLHERGTAHLPPHADSCAGEVVSSKPSTGSSSARGTRRSRPTLMVRQGNSPRRSRS